jgi:hypothetical protein
LIHKKEAQRKASQKICFSATFVVRRISWETDLSSGNGLVPSGFSRSYLSIGKVRSILPLVREKKG